jgi:UDP-glucose 4-epimerase
MSLRSPIKDSTVLVTGGAGFIGSHLVDQLLAQGATEVVVIDNLFLGSPANLAQARASGRLHFYRDDAEFAQSLEYIFGRHRIDTVFNLATKALNYSFLNPAGALSTNVTVALNLLELQRRGAFRSMCHFSTSEVYGTAVYEPMDERHPRNPTTTYAAGKAAADLAVESYVRMFGIDAWIARPFNNYGPRQNHEGLLAGVIPITAWRILSGGTPEIHGDGLQTRDFIHVQDTVRAVLALHAVCPAGQSVNVGTDNQVPIGELVERISQLLGFSGQIVRREARGADVRAHHASNARLRELIALELTAFDDGLRSTLDWYRALHARLSSGSPE